MRGSFLPNGSVKAFRKSKLPWANPRVGVDRALLAGAPRASAHGGLPITADIMLSAGPLYCKYVAA
jgi:hypothetical protein